MTAAAGAGTAMGTRFAAPAPRLPAWAGEGRDLVPGVPARVVQLADQLDAMADGLAGTDRLVQQVAAGGWAGAAAAGFKRLVSSLPAPYSRAAPLLRVAGHQVRRHAAVLAAAQRDADEALVLDRRARSMPSTPGSPTGESVPPAADALHRRAVEQVEAARARVRASGLGAAAALDRACAAAPDEPNVVLRLLHRAISFHRSVQVGAVESVATTVRTVLMLSPTRAVADPSGWWRDARAIEKGLVAAATHPVATVKTVLDPELLVDDPGRWVGHLLPDVLLGAATGGTTFVANRGVSVGVRMAESVSRGERLADLQAGIRAGTSTGRSRLRLSDVRRWSTVEKNGATRTLTPGQNMATRALARDARWAEHDLRSRLLSVGRMAHADVLGLKDAVKGKNSLRRKVSDEVATQPLHEVLPDVNDTVRYSLVPSHEAYAGAVLPIIAGLRAQGMVLVRAKDFWGKERYRGINLTLADPRTGRLLEVQVHTPGTWAATKATHKDYETFRLLPDGNPRKALLGAKIGRVFAAVPEPPGLRELSSYLRALPTTTATNRPPELLSMQVAPEAVAVGVAAGATSVVDDDRPPTTSSGGGRAPSLSCGDGRRAGRHIEHAGAWRPAGGEP